MVFITGGTGLIGSFLIAYLLEEGMAVKALYRQQIPPQWQQHPQIKWIKGDVLDTALLRKVIREADTVYHCAGLVSYAAQDAGLLRDINVTGTANIVDACLEKTGVKLCHVSSVAAIGHEKNTHILTEETKWDGAAEHSLYASSKYFGELEVWRGVSEGLNAVIVNPSVVLGPAANWGRSSTQLFKYVAEEHPFYTAGSANFVDVRDVVAAMIALQRNPDAEGQRFILNAGPLSYQEFFNQVAGCLGKKAPSVKIPGLLTEVLWRLEHLRAYLTGNRPLITKDTARITHKKIIYSSQKIKKTLPIQFRPLSESIAWCCQELQKLPQMQLNIAGN